jgi:MFS family permease
MGVEQTSQAPTRVRYLVLAWLCALALIAYVHRSCIAVATRAIQEDLCLTTQQMAWVITAFLIGYAGFQLPSGALGDRWGSRVGLTACVIVWSAATGWLGLAAGFLGLFLGRILMGVGQAGIFPCCVNTISKWFPASEKAMPSGMLAAFMSVGAVIGSALTGELLEFLDWETVFLLLGIPGLLSAGWFYLWFRNRPGQHSGVNRAELELIEEGQPARDPFKDDRAPPTPWRTLLTSPNMGFICGQQFFRAAGYFFYLSWFPTYLQKVHGFTVVESGYLNALPLLGVVLGSSAGGFLMDWIWRRTGSRGLSRKGVGFLSALISGVFLLAAFLNDQFLVTGYVRAGLLSVSLVTLSAFFAGVAGPSGYTITIDLGGRHVASVFSTMNMAGNIGAGLTPIFVAWLVTLVEWPFVMLFLGWVYLAAAACWALIDIERPVFAAPTP